MGVSSRGRATLVARCGGLAANAGPLLSERKAAANQRRFRLSLALELVPAAQ